jgi:hypothetical protein
MPTETIQTNLPQFNNPVVLNSYKPRTQKRPGTMDEWVEFVNRVSAICEDLYRDARIAYSKRREAGEARPGSRQQLEAERDFTAVLKRATEHCRNLANAFLATGMPREHLENHLELAGTEHDQRPELGIALLYCKLMGIPFREERITPVKNEETGEETVERIVEQKTHTWARDVRPVDLEDFYRTSKVLAEAMPELASKFRSGQVHF